MLWKCCTQYASKFGTLSSSLGAGKGQFSFQSQRKAVPKNVQTTAQLNSSHRLAKWCSKFSIGFKSMWTELQMFKLDLENPEEQEIKLPTSVVPLKKQDSSRKTSLSLVAKLCPTLVTPWTVACQALLSMGFSRQEYWSGLSFHQAQFSCIAGRFFTNWAMRQAQSFHYAKAFDFVDHNRLENS